LENLKSISLAVWVRQYFSTLPGVVTGLPRKLSESFELWKLVLDAKELIVLDTKTRAKGLAHGQGCLRTELENKIYRGLPSWWPASCTTVKAVFGKPRLGGGLSDHWVNILL
jgi:hypothetical protein